MPASIDTLRMFTEVVARGSFSAAARALGKGQSTVSEAMAHLEIDLGVGLFERGGRQPRLSEAGRLLLAQAREVLAAHDRFSQLAVHLHQGLEPRLSVVVSDTFPPELLERVLGPLDQRFPDIELECLIAEGQDVLDLVGTGRAQLGLVIAHPSYPPGLHAVSTTGSADLGVYVAPQHPLAQLASASRADLAAWRELRLNTLADAQAPGSEGGAARCWSAPSYLMLLEMAEQGHGWACLPQALVARYATGRLVAVNPPGWPQRRAVDLVWSADRQLGPAAHWLLQALTRPAHAPAQPPQPHWPT